MESARTWKPEVDYDDQRAYYIANADETFFGRKFARRRDRVCAVLRLPGDGYIRLFGLCIQQRGGRTPHLRMQRLPYDLYSWWVDAKFDGYYIDVTKLKPGSIDKGSRMAEAFVFDFLTAKLDEARIQFAVEIATDHPWCPSAGRVWYLEDLIGE